MYHKYIRVPHDVGRVLVLIQRLRHEQRSNHKVEITMILISISEKDVIAEAEPCSILGSHKCRYRGVSRDQHFKSQRNVAERSEST